MLSLLSKEQIIDEWENLELGINASLEVDEPRNESIKENLLNGSFRCYVAKGKFKDEIHLYGFVITSISKDMMQPKLKSLFIYIIYGNEKIPDEVWREGLDDMKAIARTERCRQIFGYTNNNRIREMVKRAGFKEKTFAYLEL